MKTRRRPWLAVILTLTLPGLGHFYCDKKVRAALAHIISWMVGYLSLSFFVISDSIPVNYFLPVLVVTAWAALLVVDVVRIARSTGDDFVLGQFNRWYYYILVLIIAELAFVVLIPTIKYKAFAIPAASMESALFVGDYFFADLSAYDYENPQSNDVVLFISPHDEVTEYVKRCVAGPGDTVMIKDKILWVNGTIIEESETVKFVRSGVQSRKEGGGDSPDNFGPYIVPEDSYFMLGDNRDNSFDSRFWGPVPQDLIIGKAIRIHWSRDRSRIGQRVL